LLKEKARFFAAALVVHDALLLFVAMGSVGELFSPDEYGIGLRIAIVVLVTAIMISFNTHGIYRSFRLEPVHSEIFRITKTFVTISMVVAILAGLFGVSRALLPWLLAVMFSGCIAILFFRLGIRLPLRRLRRYGYNYRRFFIVGCGRAARETARQIEKNQVWGIRLAGILPLDGGFQDFGNQLFSKVLCSRIIDGVIFALDEGGEDLEQIRPALQLCWTVGIPAYLTTDATQPIFAHSSSSDALGHINFISVRRESMTYIQSLLKRTFDLLASALAIAVLSPVFLVIAVLVRISSPGPVLFRQSRVGLNGRTFTLLKFRTMFNDAESQRAALAAYNEMDGPVFKIRNDPRVTPIGRFLRRMSLDELPQFFNVFAGDMSLVGPRPPLVDEVKQYEFWQRRRLSVRPGITCLWQVSGRNQLDFLTWMRLDLQYIDTWSWRLDFKILAKSLPAMLKGV
jgi:exopolysaccharide biosynthesis polyprenyl glycosylphosphotransferase